MGGWISRLDSWANAVTGLGVALLDKRTAWAVSDPGRLSDAELEAMVRGDGISRKIVGKLPEAAFRQGVELKTEDVDRAKATLGRLEEVRGLQALEDAAFWARTFGGAVVVLGVDDGQAPDRPLDYSRIHRLEWLDVLDKREVEPVETAAHMRRVEGSEHFRYVDPLDAAARELTPFSRIHRSRLLFFPGARTSRLQRQRNSGWEDSVLQAAYVAIRDFQNDSQSASALMSDASQGVFKVKNLWKMLGAQGKQAISERMAMVDQSRSVARAILIGDDEEFTRVATSFAGLPDMLQFALLKVAAVSDTPVSVFWGQAPAGMDATGESDVRGWYDSVKAYQQRIKPQVDALLKVLLVEGGQAEPEGWSSKFCPLWQPTDKEVAETRLVNAEADSIYLDHGVYGPDAVAESRFSAQGYGSEVQLDYDTRDRMAEAEDPEGGDQPEVTEPGDAGPKDSAAALAAGQIQALQALAESVAAATLPAETAVQIALVSFPLTQEQAEAIFEAIEPKEPVEVPLATPADPGSPGPGAVPPPEPDDPAA